VWLSLPDDRPLPESFKSRFGSVTVGDRGGVRVTKTLPIPTAAQALEQRSSSTAL